MGILGRISGKITSGLAIVSDWLLIVLGVLLVLIALKSIDVPAARYVVICGGILLSGLGFWYRYRRLKK